MRRLTLSTTLMMLMAALAVAGPASAAPGEGATVTNRSDCVEFFDTLFCYKVRDVQNQTVTPSGNVSFVSNGRNSFEFTGFGCNQSGSGKFNSHFLYKDGTLHESGDRNQGEYSVTCFPPSDFEDQTPTQYKCTGNRHVHYANGQAQLNRVEFECTPVTP